MQLSLPLAHETRTGLKADVPRPVASSCTIMRRRFAPDAFRPPKALSCRRYARTGIRFSRRRAELAGLSKSIDHRVWRSSRLIPGKAFSWSLTDVLNQASRRKRAQSPLSPGSIAALVGRTVKQTLLQGA